MQHWEGFFLLLNMSPWCTYACCQGSCCVLGHQELSTAVCHHHRVGQQLCVSVQQGQSQPAVQHVWLRVPHSAQVSHHARGVHTQGRRVESAERGDKGEDGPVFPESGRRVHEQVPQQSPADPHGVRFHNLHKGRHRWYVYMQALSFTFPPYLGKEKNLALITEFCETSEKVTRKNTPIVGFWTGCCTMQYIRYCIKLV